jgi:hypothetical protein
MIRCLTRNGAGQRHIAVTCRFAAEGLFFIPVLCVLFSFGCATARKAPPPTPAVVAPTMAPAPAPKTPPSPTVPEAPPPAAAQVVPPAVPAGTPLPPDERSLLVESTPPGATIVMDGRPMGKAPLRLAIPTTPLGFFRDYVELRARFIATNETEVSRTATEEFTPREKVPAVLQFTPDGAQRAVR